MNFLVYLGLANYDLPEARAHLAAKSLSLLTGEWRTHRFICENYSAITGSGSDRPNSDRFYHWGALLALIGLMEHGEVALPRVPPPPSGYPPLPGKGGGFGRARQRVTPLLGGLRRRGDGA